MLRSIRFTPLNLAVAGLLVYLGLKWMDGNLGVWLALGLFVLMLILIFTDQFFRVLLKKLSRVWLIEGVFVVLAVIAIWLLG